MFEKSEIDLAMLDIKLMAGIGASELGTEHEEPAPQVFPSHEAMCERVRKSLYYGRLPSSDRPSLPMTRLVVDRFAGVGLERLGRLDVRRAADLARDSCAGPTSLVLALIYLDRLKKNNPDYLSCVSSADLFLVSMMVASKYLHDDGEEDEVFNDEWAASGDIDIKEFNRMEVGFLSALDWRIHVTNLEFESTMQNIEKDIALREVASRGWQASYTDLCVLTAHLSPDHWLRLLVESTLKLTSVCMAAYAASFLTLLGSAALLQHTPLGPDAVQHSLRVLASSEHSAADGSKAPTTTTSSTETTDFNKLHSGGAAGMTPADLLTASILVATLTGVDGAADESVDSLDLNFMENALQPDSSEVDYRSKLQLNAKSLLAPGLELPTNTTNQARAEWLGQQSQSRLEVNTVTNNTSWGWLAADENQESPGLYELPRTLLLQFQGREKVAGGSLGPDSLQLDATFVRWSGSSAQTRCPILHWGAQSRDWLQLMLLV